MIGREKVIFAAKNDNEKTPPYYCVVFDGEYFRPGTGTPATDSCYGNLVSNT